MTPASNTPVGKQPRSRTQNRRKSNRHRLSIPATLIPEGEKQSPIEITVTEVSIGGVAFQVKSELKADAVYHLNSFDTLIPPGMKVHIVSQRKQADGSYDIGAKSA